MPELPEVETSPARHSSAYYQPSRDRRAASSHAAALENPRKPAFLS